MNTQYRKNLKAILEASKTYCDESIESLKWELGTYDLSVETVNGTTMLLPTPANTIQATMVRVDGASEVSENIIVLQDVAETTTNGITWKVQNNSIILNGTATSNTSINLNTCMSILGALTGTFTFNLFNGSADFTQTIQFYIEYQTSANRLYMINGSSVTANKTGTATNLNWGSELTKYIYVVSGATFNNFVIKPMLVKGSTAPTEFKVGYTGIHNLELTGLKVEGANLINTTDYTLGGDAYNATITITKLLEVGTTYTISFDTAISSNLVLTNATLVSASGYISRTSIVFTPTSNNVVITFAGGSTSNNLRDKLNNMAWYMLNYGSTALSYVDYIAPTTLPIDLTSIEDSGGNKLFADGKLGSAGTICDELTPYKAIARTREVVLDGTENWFISDTNDVETKGRYFYLALDNCYQVSSGSEVSEITATYFNAGNPNSIYGGASDKPYISYWSSVQRINLYDRNTIAFMTLAEFKQWLATRYANGNPIVVRYRYARPIEVSIDFSQLVKFEAHSNGSITLVNTNNQDTTSTFKYLKEVAK